MELKQTGKHRSGLIRQDRCCFRLIYCQNQQMSVKAHERRVF